MSLTAKDAVEIGFNAAAARTIAQAESTIKMFASEGKREALVTFGEETGNALKRHLEGNGFKVESRMPLSAFSYKVTW